jgi:hypothetical protein
MWPWEHFAVGYLCYSLYTRVTPLDRPGLGALLAVGFGTQLPDLIDKPLAWSLEVLPSGTSLGHSALFAVPVSGAAVALGRLTGRRPLGDALAVGYLLHLVGDALYPIAFGRIPAPTFLLWPLVPAAEQGTPGLFARTGQLIASFLEFLAGPRGWLYLGAEGALLAATALLWLLDGCPGLGAVRRAVRGVLDRDTARPPERSR